MNFKEIFKHSVTIFSKWGGESVKRRKEEESGEGPQNVDHSCGYVCTLMDPVRKLNEHTNMTFILSFTPFKVHSDGHLGHPGQGERPEGAIGNPGELQI